MALLQFPGPFEQGEHACQQLFQQANACCPDSNGLSGWILSAGLAGIFSRGMHGGRIRRASGWLDIDTCRIAAGRRVGIAVSRDFNYFIGCICLGR